ncbi:hypothetical protein [Methylobacterium sp. 1030]|uniref:hypothetical protein n=1 Tax=Methylobacterium sp. 1030 TaxID=3156404 RepID=UPI0033985C16
MMYVTIQNAMRAMRGAMDACDEFDAVTQTCIENHEAIILHGSSEMQTASRMLLYSLAAEIVRRRAGMLSETSDEGQEGKP